MHARWSGIACHTMKQQDDTELHPREKTAEQPHSKERTTPQHRANNPTAQGEQPHSTEQTSEGSCHIYTLYTVTEHMENTSTLKDLSN